MKTKKVNLTLLAVSIILVALNLRIPITSVGPDFRMIESQYSLSAAVAGIITTIPLLVFAVLSPIVPSISAKFGYGRLMLLALALIALGEIVRSFLGEVGLFLGTFIIGAGIATSSVLIPSVLKHRFPNKVGPMTSIYVSCMNVIGGIGVWATIPISKYLGWTWQPTLSIWIIFALIAIVFWLPFYKQHIEPETNEVVSAQKPIWKFPIAWWVSLFLGIQSVVSYGLITWLPSIVESKGMTEEFATDVTFVFLIFTIPASLLVPILCAKLKSQSGLMVGLCVVYILGLCMFLYADTHITIMTSVGLVSLSTGGCISAALLFFVLRSSTAKRTTQLSGLAQSIGYLFGAIGPMLLGAMYDHFHSWNQGIIAMIIISLFLVVSGFMAGRDTQID